MSSDDITRMALEALEADDSKLWPSDKRTRAIAALRERLAQQSELDEAIAAGDGTLHGAIDFWHEEARRYAQNADYWRSQAERLAQPDHNDDLTAAYMLGRYESRQEQLKPCHSPYCECEKGKCTHPGFYDARHEQPNACPHGVDDGACKECYAEQAEPVAWGMPRADGAIFDVITPEEHARAEGGYTVPLYTHPHREWQGLTDEDIQNVRENCGITHHAIKTIEAALREKNRGDK